MRESRDVVIVGAGAAGLNAARELSRAGLDVLVLESAARIGGRIFTTYPAGSDLPVELGAEFLHGDAPTTRALLDEFGLRQVEGEGGQWRAQAGTLEPAPRQFERIGRLLARIDPHTRDVSFTEFLERTRAPRQDRAMALRFVEGFHAADATRISAHALAGPAGEVEAVRRAGHVLAGQAALIRALAAAAGSEIRTGTRVSHVAWRRHRCDVVADSAGAASTIRCRAVILTPSIGVLQRRDIVLDPEPRGYARALGLLTMGDVVRIPFIFDTRFWEDRSLANGELQQAGFIHTPGSPFNVWWTQYPVLAPMLVAWAGGTAAGPLNALPAEQRADVALRELARALGLAARELQQRVVQWQTHDWTDDPHVRGAYSYALVGGANAAKALARVHEGTLALAGEALSEETGTVEGALASGARAARSLLRALRR